jgi:hypothetical protein
MTAVGRGAAAIDSVKQVEHDAVHLSPQVEHAVLHGSLQVSIGN